MNTDKLKLACGAALMLALSGCMTNPILQEPGDAAFGEANRQTMMAQVINPDPQYDEPMVTSGEHAQQAVERYRTGTVKQPENVRTSELGDGPSN